MDTNDSDNRVSHQEICPAVSNQKDMSTCGVLHSIGSDLTRTRGRAEALQNGSIRSEQAISKTREQGNTPISRAQPVASRESFAQGNENGKRNVNISTHCDEGDTITCSMSSQDKHLRKASTVREPILQYSKRQKTQAA